jgi:hypothetical protein
MSPFKKVATVGALGVVALSGGAFGGGLLNAGAATTTTPQPSATGSGFKSNEDPAHEANESAAREKAENDGTASFGHRGAGPRGGGFPNEDPAHEAGESAAREKAEHDGSAGPGPAAPATPGQSGSGSSGT